MVSETKIEWATKVWNPVTGCTKISPGCDNCYAERMAKRLAGRVGYPKDESFEVTFHSNRLVLPLKWRKPQRVFINSMGDIFHDDVENWMIDKIFGVILASNVLVNKPDHVFMVLTKRPERMRQYFTERQPVDLIKAWTKASDWITLNNLDVLFLDLVYSETCRDWDERGRNSNGSAHLPWGYIDKLWPLPNLLLGVTAENQEQAEKRIPVLLQIPAAVRFVSVEPMLSAIDLREWMADCGCVQCKRKYYTDLDELEYPENDNTKCPDCGGDIVSFSGYKKTLRPNWVICGGESGPGARPMHLDWVRSLRDQCQASGTPYFFKQWGGWEPVEQVDHGFLPDNEHRLASHMVIDLNGEDWSGAGGNEFIQPGWHMHRVGKKKAGRLLDGRTWDEIPGVTANGY